MKLEVTGGDEREYECGEKCNRAYQDNDYTGVSCVLETTAKRRLSPGAWVTPLSIKP